MGLAVALVAGCASKHGNGNGNGSADAGGIDAYGGPFPDFPATPIADSGSASPPGNAATLFGAPGTGSAGGPCMIEPEIGTLYPQNWLRPRFTWLASGSENLFELRITAANEVNPLVVYTTATQWTMPADIWSALASHIIEQPLTVTVRGATYDGVSALTSGPDLGTTGDIAIAAVAAPGAIVYWTTSDGTAFRGFHIGDETVQTIGSASDDAATTLCVGCHTSTPDGSFVAYSATDNAGNGNPAFMSFMSSDGTHQKPSYLSATAEALLTGSDRIGQELPQFSAMHWRTGDRVELNMFAGSNGFGIMWTDLEATSAAEGSGWGFLARGGDPNPAASASFAHTTDTIVYTSSPSVSSGATVTQGTIYTVPFGNRLGGSATAVPGAHVGSDDNDYYPVFSPDDRYIAYTVAPIASGNSYANPDAEIYVIPASGGTPTRLAANAPPLCSGQVSPGVENSWPKWAPDATTANGKTYYWLTFSSTRSTGFPQLYVTPVVDDGTSITTYPALYLWNQPADEHNHTPAWDNFQIVQ